jgi:hypothetical protein
LYPYQLQVALHWKACWAQAVQFWPLLTIVARPSVGVDLSVVSVVLLRHCVYCELQLDEHIIIEFMSATAVPDMPSAKKPAIANPVANFIWFSPCYERTKQLCPFPELLAQFYTTLANDYAKSS